MNKQKKHTKLSKANTGGGQLCSPLPLHRRVPGYMPSAARMDTGMRRPLCPQKPLQVTETFSSKSRGMVKLQLYSGLQTQLCKCWAPHGALRTSWDPMLNSSLVHNMKPQSSLFMCLYHNTSPAFSSSLTMNQCKPIFHALPSTYKIYIFYFVRQKSFGALGDKHWQ